MKLFRSLGLFGIVAIATACQTTEGGDSSTANGPHTEKSGPSIQAALDKLPSAHVKDVDANGIPYFVTGNLGSTPNGKYRDVLNAVAPVFRGNPDQLVFRDVLGDVIGDSHLRFKQTKNGREVLGGDLTIHTRNHVAYAANGTVRDDVNAPADASISIDQALAAVKGDADYAQLTDLAAVQKGELVYLRGAAKVDLTLVYQIEVTGVKADQTPVRDTVLVDAISGKIALKEPHIHTAQDRRVHNLNHGTSLPGPVARTEGQEPNADETVNLNYDRLGTVYQAYFDLYGRDSFDNAGATLISSVHYSTNYVNAFWNGTQMVYGDGDNVTASNLAHSLDVTGHELTHAVTERTSNLIYSGESGGLNESMSDIFGNVVEWFRDGKVVSNNTWLVGEDCWTPATPDDALRYMNDPARDNRSLDYYPDYSPGTDVHYSSGISNLAFYMLSQGGTHPRGKTTQAVNGIGFEKAAKVFYLANTGGFFQRSTNFAQAKTATEQAAAQLGFTTDEIESVSNAWKSVGVGVPIPPPEATPIENNVPVPNLTGTSGAKIYFTLDVPAGAESLKFVTSGGTGDADLYVKFGTWPTTADYDCRSWGSSNNETCNIPDTAVQGGKYWVMIHAYAAFSGLTLNGSYLVVPPGRLVINEVNYDDVGNTDTAEFVEIYNVGGKPVNLANHTLWLVDGIDDSAYGAVDLSPALTLAPGQYLVVGARGLQVPEGTKKINFQGFTNQMQNGTPDGLAITNGTTVVDVLSYEGVVTTANIPDVGVVNLVEGARTTAEDSNSTVRSVSRIPNGNDTNNAATDWRATATVTPGAAN